MAFIKVWCEYDISGSFGGDNDRDVYEVSDELDALDIDRLLIDEFSDLAEEVECETDLIEEGLMGWEYITVEKLKYK